MKEPTAWPCPELQKIDIQFDQILKFLQTEYAINNVELENKRTGVQPTKSKLIQKEIEAVFIGKNEQMGHKIEKCDKTINEIRSLQYNSAEINQLMAQSSLTLRSIHKFNILRMHQTHKIPPQTSIILHEAISITATKSISQNHIELLICSKLTNQNSDVSRSIVIIHNYSLW